MFELWAKKRPINDLGQTYQFIENFDNKCMIHTMIDMLDKNIYQEAMVIIPAKNNKDVEVVFYQEFPKNYQYVKKKGK